MPDHTKQSENAAESANAGLERAKLELEIDVLRHQLSRTNMVVEWMKAATVPILALFVTGWLGYEQLIQTSHGDIAKENDVQEGRDLDNFNKASTQLTSEVAAERLQGAESLHQLIFETSSAHRGQALDNLVNALSSESNPAVQSTILTSIWDLNPGVVSPDALKSALVTALERDRGDTAYLIGMGKDNIIAAKRRKIATLLGMGIDGVSYPIADILLDKLPFKAYRSYSDIDPSPLDNLAPEQTRPLEGLEQAIDALLARKASFDNFSVIRCADCDFTSVNMQGPDASLVNFDGAFLSGAHFQKLNLNGVKFGSADLSGADFSHARLGGATFSWEPNTDSDLSQINHLVGSNIPILTGADLRSANLSGMLLVTMRLNVGKQNTFELIAPDLEKSQIDEHTSIFPLRALLMIRIDDSYLDRLSDKEQTVLLRKLRDPSSPDSFAGLLAGVGDSPTTELIHVRVQCQGEPQTYMLYMLEVSISDSEFARMKGLPRTLLLDYLSRSKLNLGPTLTDALRGYTPAFPVETAPSSDKCSRSLNENADYREMEPAR